MAYPATPKTWVAGDVLTAAQLNAELRDALLAAFPLSVNAWTAYTPAWSGTIGNGTITAAYMRVGRLIHYRIKVAWGTTTSHPVANQSLTLPVAPHAVYTVNAAMGVGIAHDAAVAAYPVMPIVVSGSTVLFKLIDGGAIVSHATPHTWGNGDDLSASGFYEAAT